jgi:WG repeat protein
MAARFWVNVSTLIIVMVADGTFAQDKPPELTPVGKAIFEAQVAADRVTPNDFPGRSKPGGFPLAMCAFPGGLCGAVNRDGSVAVLPRYDWVGPFSDNRAAIRIGGLYGFVDEDGREIVKPQYRIVDDYKFGFAQVDVDGKSGLIDRDGKMVIAPTCGFIEAIGPDRFRVSEVRQLGGTIGGEDFSGIRGVSPTALSMSISLPVLRDSAAGVIDRSGQWIEPPGTSSWSPAFEKDDPSIRWVRRNKLWGLARADGTWLIEPKFEQADPLRDGLARVKLDGKFGFIDRTGHFAIEPVFDMAWWFEPGVGRTSAERDGIFGVIDKTGSWVFQTNYQQINLAVVYGKDRSAETVFGWNFKKDDRWGLLDLHGLVVLDADFDQSIQRCADGRLKAYKNKEWLFFKADGSPLLPPNGGLIDGSCDGVSLYTMKIGEKFGLVDARLNPLTPVHFDVLTSVRPGVKNAKVNGKWGRIGPDGHWLLEPKFDYLSNGVDIFVASIDGKRGFMRSDGSWLIEPKFDAAGYRGDDTAFVTVAGATGVLRLSDQSWVVAPRPGVMCNARNAIMSQADGKRVILSQIGETWIDIGAERVGINFDMGLLTFLKNGKWGLVDTAGRVMVEPQFEEPVYFARDLRGVAWAKRGGNWCAIDRRGSLVSGIPCADADPTGPSYRFECKVEP